MRGVWFVVLAGCSGGPNHAPVVEPLSITTAEDQRVAFSLIATDADGDDLAIDGLAPTGGRIALMRSRPTAHGLQLDLAFDPARDWSGDASFTVHVSDGEETVEQYLELLVTPVNDAPEGTPDRIAATVDTVVTIFGSTLLANDRDVDAEGREPTELVVVAVAGPSRGTVALASDQITFTPEPGFRGTARFVYTPSDGVVATQAVAVMVDVGGPNAAPLAVDDLERVMEDEVLVLRPPALTRNDLDPDGHALMVIGVGNATHGTVETEGGYVRFTPEPYFFDVAGFDYTVSDGAATATGHVSVEVLPWL